MNAGFAETDITPEPGEEMIGYGYYLNRRAVGTLDPLRARALALQEGEDRAVVAQLDLIGLAKDFVADLRAEVARRTGLPPTHLLLHCTHTHSGPATMPLFGCGMPSEHYLFLLRQRLPEAIERALADLRPVAAASRFAADWPEGFAHNRVGGPELDSHVRGIRLELDGGRPIVVLSYACHPVTLGVNREYSADYCGAVVREFTTYGDRAMFLNGCCGDVDPVSNAVGWGSGTRETLLILGHDLAAVARRAMATAQPWQPGPLRACSRMVRVESEPTSLEGLRASLAQVRAVLAVSPADSQLRVSEAWHETQIRLHETGTLAEAATAEVQAIACGDVAFVGLSAEAFTGLGQTIRAAAPDHHLMIAATSNGVLGYIATADDVRGGGYASQASCRIYSMPIPVPGAGEQWAAEGARVVAEVFG